MYRTILPHATGNSPYPPDFMPALTPRRHYQAMPQGKGWRMVRVSSEADDELTENGGENGDEKRVLAKLTARRANWDVGRSSRGAGGNGAGLGRAGGGIGSRGRRGLSAPNSAVDALGHQGVRGDNGGSIGGRNRFDDLDGSRINPFAVVAVLV